MKSLLQKCLQVNDLIINSIKSPIVQKIYSLFKFINIPFSQNDENNESNYDNSYTDILVKYLSNFKFITFQISDISEINKNNKADIDSSSKSKSQVISAIICIENECFIIEQIYFSDFNKIISILDKKSVTLNLSIINKEDTSTEMNAKLEIENFCKFFATEIKNNKFIKQTIRPIVGFMIRRYFYPTFYFKDTSFFNFNHQNISNDQKMKAKLLNFLESKKAESLPLNIANEINVNIDQNNINNTLTQLYDSNNQIFNQIFLLCDQITCLVDQIITIDSKKDIKSNNSEFYKTDFIFLRTVYSNESYLFNLVIHKETLYVFMMKIIRNIKNTTYFQREISFCENYSHRCMTRFYGFLKENQKIIGFIYEFMSNDSLDSFVSSHNDKIDEVFSFIAIDRIFSGIGYLHSNSLIFRDLKPKNILIDHDFLPYISDFETIRHPDTESTNDIGSILYTSPEQDKGEYVSYATDIYSFGLIIYYIIEKKNLFNNYYLKTTKSMPHLSNKASINIIRLFDECIKVIPTERITCKGIKNVIVNEFDSFNYFEKLLLNDSENEQNSKIIHYMIEKIICQHEKATDSILMFILFLFVKYKEGKSSLLFNLGNIYENGMYFGQDLEKARVYYELAAKMNNINALVNLANFYINGYGVEQNYLKAKEYYDLAAQQNCPTAYINLGILYYKGMGVKIDYVKAREYFELASKYNNPSVFNYLGNIYFKGQGVKQDYIKAKEYFELAGKLNNPEALNNLGYMYFNGYGVHQNFLKAKEYFESSSKYNNSEAINNLGVIYDRGYGVKKDHLKAKTLFETAAKYNNSNALNNLGAIYEKGKIVKQDFLKAKEYYEMSARQNNSYALYNLGILYYNGYGVKQDFEKAKEYTEMSAQLDNSQALYNLGNIYLNGYNTKQDYLRAKYYYELAIKLNNNSNALNKLGIMYENGYGVEKKYSKAKEYYELAAQEDNSEALYNLGMLYLKDKGIKQSMQNALKYFESSSMHNNQFAFLQLGILYQEGIGVEKDYLKAKDYYEIAESRWKIEIKIFQNFKMDEFKVQ